jgi:hypothetical protein
MIVYQELFECLGQPVSSAQVQALLTRLGIKERPEIDPENDRYNDWTLIRQQGLELGFSDSFYFQAKPYAWWGKGELLLTQLYFYQEVEDEIAPFSGIAPFNIKLTDDQEAVRTKLANHESLRRSYLSDTWEWPTSYLNVQYDEGCVEKLAYCLKAQPIVPQDTPLVLETQSLLNCLAMEIDGVMALPMFAELSDEDRAECFKDEEIDLRHRNGVELYFYCGEKTLCSSVLFYADRMLDSTEWTGTLPFDLNFNMTPDELMKHMSEPPLEQRDYALDGFATWEKEGVRLHVLYSTLMNKLLRVKVSLYLPSNTQSASNA